MGHGPYQTASEAIHDVRATPGFQAGLSEKGYSRLQQKKPVPLNEMRKFLADGSPLRRETAATRGYDTGAPAGYQTPAAGVRPIGMTRPEILVFERAVKELPRDYISRRSATVKRRVWGSSSGKWLCRTGYQALEWQVGALRRALRR